MNHREKFKHGILVFAAEVCSRQRDLYIQLMHRNDGYIKAAKQFFAWSSYLTKEEIQDLFEREVLPKWMTDIYEEVETNFFGQSLWKHR